MISQMLFVASDIMDIFAWRFLPQAQVRLFSFDLALLLMCLAIILWRMGIAWLAYSVHTRQHTSMNPGAASPFVYFVVRELNIPLLLTMSGLLVVYSNRFR